MSAAIPRPTGLLPDTEERLANLLSNPDSGDEDLYAHRTGEPDQDSAVLNGGAP